MNELTERLNAILDSRRWMIGNVMGACYARVLGRSATPHAADRVRQICSQYADWKENLSGEATETVLADQQVRQLQAWLDELRQAFSALVRSRRWKAGNLAVGMARAMILRPSTPISIHRVRDLLDTPLPNPRRLPRRNVTGLSLADLYGHLGFVCEKSRRWERAAEAYEQAIRLGATRPGQYYRLARVRGRQGRWRDAAKLYEEAVNGDQTRALWFFRLGYAHEKCRSWARAASAYERAVELDRTQPRWLYRLARTRERLRSWEEAVSLYDRALQLDPTRSESFYRLGQALERTSCTEPVYHPHIGLRLRKRGSWTRAAQAYRSALALDPTKPRYHFRLGHALEKLRDFRGAAGPFAEAARLRPEKDQWLYRLGRAREQCLDLEGALEAYGALLARAPDHSKTRSRIHAVYIKLARWEQVSKALSDAEEGGPLAVASSSAAAGVAKLRGLFEREDALTVPEDVGAAIQEAKQAAHLLPVEWWFALHWRLVTAGHVSVAYDVKDVAASLIVGRASNLGEAGLTRYLEVGKALIQLGRTTAAFEHLQPLSNHSPAETDVQLATLKLAADIDAFLGEFESSRRAVDVHCGANLAEAEAVFRELVSDRSVAVVGPLSSGMTHGEEIDSYDVVVRTNFLAGSLEANHAAKLGTRTDVSYVNGVASLNLGSEIREALARKKLKMVVMRPSSYMHGRSFILEPGDLRYNPSESNVLLRARSFGIQRILHDILRYRPRAVKVFNVDFFASASTYKKHYKAGELLANIDPFYLGSGHDYRADFLFTKRLRDRGLISGDEVVERLLDHSHEEYLRILDQRSEPAERLTSGYARTVVA